MIDRSTQPSPAQHSSHAAIAVRHCLGLAVAEEHVSVVRVRADCFCHIYDNKISLETNNIGKTDNI